MAELKVGDMVVALGGFGGDAAQSQLTLMDGEKIEIVALTETGWHYGKKTDGTEGYFPSNYVQEAGEYERVKSEREEALRKAAEAQVAEETAKRKAEEEADMKVRREEEKKREKQAQAAAAKRAAMDKEITEAQDKVDLAYDEAEAALARWEAMKVALKNLTDTADGDAPIVAGVTVVCVSDFVGDATASQLSFHAKDLIKVIATTETGWHFGAKEDGLEGYFPVNFVQNLASDVNAQREKAQINENSALQIYKLRWETLQKAEDHEYEVFSKYDPENYPPYEPELTEEEQKAADAAKAKPKKTKLQEIEEADRKSASEIKNVDPYKGFKKPTAIPWTDDNKNYDEFTFIAFADKHFRQHIRGLTGTPVANAEMIVHSLEPIENSLLDMEDVETGNEAVQLYQSVMKYMGDMETKSVQDTMITHLVTAGIATASRKDVSDLRDEIICQVCKQLNQNPDKVSMRRGWILLHTLLDYFHTSPRFEPTFIHLMRAYHETEHVEEAKTAEMKHRKTKRLGCRTAQPTKLELACLASGKPMPLKVYLCDGTFKSIQTEPQTTFADLTHKVATVLFKNSNIDRRRFAIYENGTFSSAGMTSIVATAHDRARDRLAHWESRRVVDGQFLFKIKVFTKEMMDKAATDPELANLVYQQAVNGVVSGLVTIEQQTVMRLAVLQLFIDILGDAKAVATRIQKKPEVYFPDHRNFLKKNSPIKLIADFEKKIGEMRGQGMDNAKCQREYIKIVGNLPTFGRDIFEVEHKSGGTSLPKRMNLGIDGTGVAFIDQAGMKLLQVVEFSQVDQWGASPKLFILVVKSPAGNVQYQFGTKVGQTICDIIGEITAEEEPEPEDTLIDQI